MPEPVKPLIFNLACHLRGAVIRETAVLQRPPFVLYLWTYQHPEGMEKTLVVQRRHRQFVRWREFNGSLAQARAHYEARLQEVA